MRMLKPHLLAISVAMLPIVGCTEQEIPPSFAPVESGFPSSGGSSLALLDHRVGSAIAELKEVLEGLQTADAFNREQVRALDNHLENARHHFEENRYGLARAQFIAFQEQVKQLVVVQILTPINVQPLLDGVGRIVLMLPEQLACRDRADIEQMLQESLADEQQRPWRNVSVLLQQAIYVHEPFAIVLRLSEAGQPILDADVKADMYSPAGKCVAVRLLDDGTGADESASDGEYAGTMAAPTVPGQYTFVVTVIGMDEQGTPFTRVKLLSRHATIHLSPFPYGGDSLDNPGLPWLGEPPREYPGRD